MENDCFIMFGIEINVCIDYFGMVAVHIDHTVAGHTVADHTVVAHMVAVRIAADHIVADHMVFVVRIAVDHKAAAARIVVVLRIAAVHHTVAGYSYNAETAEFV